MITNLQSVYGLQGVVLPEQNKITKFNQIKITTNLQNKQLKN